MSPSSTSAVSEEDVVTKSKLFFTTSDLMNKMNDVLKTMESPGELMTPHFELQKRLPNGTIVKADKKDIEVADMESKFKQAAIEVQDLTRDKKLEWAQKQRMEGNKLYKNKMYTEAIDVYLTCLVVKSDDLEFIEKVFLPVMNNLAQCTLQLGFYKKAQIFCTMALEEGKIQLLDKPEAISKLFYRRSKAYRLSGEYKKASRDLDKAKHFLPKGSTNHKEVIENEYKILETSSERAKSNMIKQQLAMKRMFERSSRIQKQCENKSESVDTVHFPASKDSEVSQKSHLYSTQNRKYSTLRSRCKKKIDERRSRRDLSFLEYYLTVIGSVAERLLIMIGDEETTEKEKRK